ncbi:MAG: hypothetical protein FVQ77_05430 [Cytophagales bacterium]|nr:hypothetical protein [Cytophagales bacterium]
MKKLIFIGLFFAFAGGLVLTGCKKEKEKEPKPTTDTQSTTDNDLAQSEFDDVYTTTDEVMETNKGTIGRLSAPVVITVWDSMRCAWVTINTIAKTIDINFPDTTCTSYDEKERRGKIHITYTARLRIPQAVVTVTTDSFYINGNKVEGTKRIENMNTVSNFDSMTFNIKVYAENGDTAVMARVILSDGAIIQWKTDRIRKHFFKTNWPIPGWWKDDEFEITGSASGVNRANISFLVNIIKPLRRKRACLFYPTPSANRTVIPVSGTIEVKPDNKDKRVIDFGDGTCDKIFTVTVANVVCTCTAGVGCNCQ